MLWGNFYLGGIVSPRQLMTVVLFVACIMQRGIKIDKYWWLYIVFIICFGISSSITGYSANFYRILIGYFFTAYVAYCSTIIMVKKYYAETTIVYVFLIIGLLDAVVTIAQFYTIPIANEFVEYMHFQGTRERFLEAQETMDIGTGITIPGIVGDVLNGYLLSFVSILALYNKEGVVTIRNIIVWLLIMFASFCVQERSGFYVGLVLSFVMIVKMVSSSQQNYRIVILPLLLILASIAVSYVYNMMLVSDTRYSMGADMSDRSYIYARAWEFFKQHPFGGIFLCRDTVAYPHNLFLNALIYGGWFGGLMIFIILGMQYSKMIPFFFRPIKGHDSYMKVLCTLTYTVYTINSMVHNSSIVTGNPNIWIIWGCFVALSERVPVVRKQTA